MLSRKLTAFLLIALVPSLALAEVDGWRSPGDAPLTTAPISENNKTKDPDTKTDAVPASQRVTTTTSDQRDADGTVSVVKQATPIATTADPASTVQLATAVEPAARVASRDDDANLRPIAKTEREPIAHVTKGVDTLPNEHGQVWRDYDITPYTNRVSSDQRPQQLIVDWILRETGHEVWHGETVAILSANDRRLRVYHTPAVQNIVSQTVDRFVRRGTESHAFSVRVATLTSPNWRTKAHQLLEPIEAETQGVEAWLISKENMALLLASLSRRSDYREYSSPQQIVQNGMASNLQVTRPRSYVRGIQPNAAVWPGFEQKLGQINEGYTFGFNPLLSLDGRSIDAVVKYQIDQVEKLVNVGVEVPSVVAPKQKAEIQVPQIASWKLHERFTWPVDKVLLISGGIVAKPVAAQEGALRIPLISDPPRADCLVFIESKGEVAIAADAVKTTQQPAKAYHGRY